MKRPVYYNEHEPFMAEWLRKLIAEGIIADGEVDSRSVVDVRADDLRGFRQCHFFAGLGGWPLALRLAGYADLECWTGSCPCQPFSNAGKKAGFDDARHLWPVWKKLIAERRPPVVFGEQVAAASDWLRLVRSDLETLDYAVGAMPVEAASAGAFHLRDRYWFVADHAASREGRRGIQRPAEGAGPDQERPSSESAGSSISDVGDPDNAGLERRIAATECAGERAAGPSGMADAERVRFIQSEGCKRDKRGWVGDGGQSFVWIIGSDGKARPVKPGIRLLAHGIPNRVGSLRGFGNAIDPRPAAAFIRASMEAIADLNT